MQDKKNGRITSAFKPAFGLKNAHLQTIFAKYLSPKFQLETQKEIITLPDGDELQLNWLINPNTTAKQPFIILFHGLEGDINSHYIQGMMAEFKTRGWSCVLMHFRGCNGVPNKLARAYHSGDTADAAFVIEEVKRRYPNQPLAAIGYSLGGNVLLKYCAEQGINNPLRTATAICPPIWLSACAKRIGTGSSKIYQKYLMDKLKRSTLAKLENFKPFPLPLTKEQVLSFTTLEEFDNHFTAPIHGFLNAEDYYEKASSKPLLRQIKIPTLIIHAKDDPFLSDAVIPTEEELNEHIQYELSLYGGHVGFVSGSLFKPTFWLNTRVPNYINEQLSL